MLRAGNPGGKSYRKETRMKRGILASREELQALRSRIGRNGFDEIHDVLDKRCALILESQLPTEAQWRSLWHQGKWGSAVTAARTAQGRIIDLLVSHAIDPNRAYQQRAIEEMKNLLSWTTWQDPCYPNLQADLATAEAAVAVTIGLDWLWEDLVEADRQRVVDKLKVLAIEPYLQAQRQKTWWTSCYHHWNAVLNGGIGLAAAALSDEDADAAEALDWARRNIHHFLNALNSEGGWDEGTGYWGYGFRYLLLLAEALARLEDDQRLYHHRGMDQTGLFPIYFTPNGRAASFGDNPAVPAYGTFYLLDARLGCRPVSWWLDRYGFRGDIKTTGWSAAGLALVFRPENASQAKAELEPLKVFSQIGWAALADRWPDPSLYVAIKCGDLAANHSQRDMNSIQVQVDGEMLLTDPGSPSDSAAFSTETDDEFYQVQARSHNTLTVAEADHVIDAQGRILDSGESETFRWVACSGGDALGEAVRYVRHLVMLLEDKTGRPQGLVVVDELDLASPEKTEMFWHSRGKIDLDAKSLTGTIRGRNSGLHFALASTATVSAGLESGPTNGYPDNYIHLSGGVIGQSLLATLLTLDPLPGSLDVQRDLDGAVVSAGKLQLTFRAGSSHLQLQDVRAPLAV